MSPYLELNCYWWHYQSTDSPSSIPSFPPISPSRPQQKSIFYLDKESACDAVAGTSSSRSTGSSRQWWQQWPQRESQLRRCQQWSSGCRAQTKINYAHATESATETDTVLMTPVQDRDGWILKKPVTSTAHLHKISLGPVKKQRGGNCQIWQRYFKNTAGDQGISSWFM